MGQSGWKREDQGHPVRQAQRQGLVWYRQGDGGIKTVAWETKHNPQVVRTGASVGNGAPGEREKSQAGI